MTKLEEQELFEDKLLTYMSSLTEQELNEFSKSHLREAALFGMSLKAKRRGMNKKVQAIKANMNKIKSEIAKTGKSNDPEVAKVLSRIDDLIGNIDGFTADFLNNSRTLAIVNKVDANTGAFGGNKGHTEVVDGNGGTIATSSEFNDAAKAASDAAVAKFQSGSGANV